LTLPFQPLLALAELSLLGLKRAETVLFGLRPTLMQGGQQRRLLEELTQGLPHYCIEPVGSHPAGRAFGYPSTR